MDQIDVFKNFVLGQRVRVLMNDDRLIEGYLGCFDKNMNFIVEGTIEYYNTTPEMGKSYVTPNLLSPC